MTQIIVLIAQIYLSQAMRRRGIKQENSDQSQQTHAAGFDLQ
jgi:hypothetical protein